MTRAVQPPPSVRLEREGRVARVAVGTGTKRNALNSAGWAGVEDVFRELSTHDGLRAVVMRGAGGTFSAGSDMREWADAEPAAVEESFVRMEAACRAIEELPVPVIAQVLGSAAGAGCQLALACDLQVMADTAQIGMPIARLGILVTHAFAARISDVAGPGVARELLYTGRLMAADEAARVGLVSHCVPESQVEAASEAIIEAMLPLSAAAVRAAKRAVNAMVLPARDAAGAPASGPAVAFDDFQRGVRAFLEHRTPE